jgi:hypothetical protein
MAHKQAVFAFTGAKLLLEMFRPGHAGSCTLFGCQYPGFAAKSINLTKLLRAQRQAGSPWGSVTPLDGDSPQAIYFEELLGVAMIIATMYFAEDLWGCPAFSFVHTTKSTRNLVDKRRRWAL